MSVAFFSLLVVVAAAPVLLFLDDSVVVDTIALYAAIGMLIVAASMRPLAARHLFKVIRVPAAFAVIPLAWMIIQLLPLPTGGISRSIWDSAASALGTPLAARMSVDPGLTLLSLGRLVSLMGIAFIAAAVSIERREAEKLLSTLAAVAGVISLVGLADQQGAFHLLNGWDTGGAGIAAAISGTILFASILIMIMERYELERHRGQSLPRLLVAIGLAVAGLAICCLTLIAGQAIYALFAAACGLSIILIVYFLRRLGFGPRAGLAIGCIAVAVAAAIVATKATPVAGDVSLRYMATPDANLASLDSRMIDAVELGGSGAGAFGVISVLYGMQGPPERLLPPTFATKVAVELGRPALWIIVALTCALILLYARGAFERGRDFFFPLAAAALLAAMVVSSFCEAVMPNTAVSLLVATTLGLGCGQRASRRHEMPAAVDGGPFSVGPKSIKRQDQFPLFRVVVAAWALAIAVFGAWATAAQLMSPQTIFFPSTAAEADALDASRNSAIAAAKIGFVRGDLWTTAAVTGAARLLFEPADRVPEQNARASSDDVRAIARRGAELSPHDPRIWLTLAAIDFRLGGKPVEIGELLKLSYYTGPNELSLMPLRLTIAVQSHAIDDDELLESLVPRDIQNLVRQRPDLKSAIALAYKNAVPKGREIIEAALVEADPRFLDTLAPPAR
jgi:hypothetical protein